MSKICGCCNQYPLFYIDLLKVQLIKKSLCNISVLLNHILIGLRLFTAPHNSNVHSNKCSSYDAPKLWDDLLLEI